MLYLFVGITIMGVVSAQLLLKKGLLAIGFIPTQLSDFLPFFMRAFTNIYVLLGLFCALIASLSWITAVSKSELGHVYPIVALDFVLVAILSSLIFKENISITGWIGILCVCTGVFLVVRS
jgi:drug/metabolite transporter (DMT)-like permease